MASRAGSGQRWGPASPSYPLNTHYHTIITAYHMYMLHGTSQYHCEGQSAVEALVVVQKTCRTEGSSERATLPLLMSLLVDEATPSHVITPQHKAGLSPLMYTLEEVSSSSWYTTY